MSILKLGKVIYNTLDHILIFTFERFRDKNFSDKVTTKVLSRSGLIHNVAVYKNGKGEESETVIALTRWAHIDSPVYYSSRSKVRKLVRRV